MLDFVSPQRLNLKKINEREPALSEESNRVSKLLNVSSSLNQYLTVHRCRRAVTHCRYSATCEFRRWQKWGRWPDRKECQVLPAAGAVGIRSVSSSARRHLEAYWNCEVFEHSLLRINCQKILEKRKSYTFSRGITLSHANKSDV
jgi:hypothetical protein